MEKQINIDTFEYIIDRIFERFGSDFIDAIEDFQENENYLSQTHFGDFLLFENDYIRLYNICDTEEFELEYKFEPFGTWQSIANFIYY